MVSTTAASVGQELVSTSTLAPAAPEPVGVAMHAELTSPALASPVRSAKPVVRLYVAAQNRLLREALLRRLRQESDVECAASQEGESFDGRALADGQIDVLLLVSRGNLDEDIARIQDAHAMAPQVRILLLGPAQKDGEFLQCVRAGISGLLFREASGEEIVQAIRAVQRGEAVCPGALCSVLFRYFERDSSALPSAKVRDHLGFTRREQQLIPLVAKGLTNKEIASQLYLSEQTVKNHLYRMKRKIGAADRLSIVQQYRTQGFLL